MKTLIEVTNLSKRYNKTYALKDVSITLVKGDIYGLIGRNGAGKTTLLKAIVGLIRPTQGAVEVFKETAQANIYNNVGYMMNSNFYGYLNAEQNMTYFKGLKGITDKHEVTRVLTLVGLDGVKKKYKDYSLGMKQRLGVANALLGNPPIILLDEPINGLDPEGIRDFREMIQEMSLKGTTFIISSHILGELGLVATKFGFIDKGVLIEEISKEALLEKLTKGLVLNTSDNKRAVVILETELNITNYTVNNQDDIIINEETVNINDITKKMVSANIEINKIQQFKHNLEDYFFEVTGGK